MLLPLLRQRDTSERRVKRGARVLDKNMPGWEQKINTSTLDINSMSNCVLGQLYGGYSNGLRALGFMGFMQGSELADYGDESGFYFEEDTDAWVKLIDKRKLARSA